MAREFDDADNQFLRKSSNAGVTTGPLTMAAWVKSDLAGNQGIGWLGQSGAGVNWWSLWLSQNIAQLRAAGYAFGASSQGLALSSNNFAPDTTWHHVVFVESSGNSNRLVYQDGVKGDLETTTPSVSGTPNRLTLGRWDDSSPSSPLSGAIAEFGLWDIALSSADVDNLFTNMWAPGLVQAGNLQSWLRGDQADSSNNEADQQGGAEFVSFGDAGAVGSTDHPAGIVYSLGAGVTSTTPSVRLSGVLNVGF